MVLHFEGISSTESPVWATPTHELVPDIMYMRDSFCPMLGGYKNGVRQTVDIYKSPFFRPGQRLDDHDRWLHTLHGYSQWLQMQYPNVARLRMEEDLTGEMQGYEKANKAFLKESIISESEMNKLISFAHEENNPLGMRRMAAKIASWATTQEAITRDIEINAIESHWRNIRRTVSHGNIKGADALQSALYSETDEVKRELLVRRLNKQNATLADLLLRKRELLVQPVSYEPRSYKERCADDFTDDESDQLFSWITTAWNKASSQHVSIQKPKRLLTDDVLWEIAVAQQIEPVAELIRTKYTKSLERCYRPFPPYEVYAAIGTGTDFDDEVTKLHEIGHAEHHVNVDDNLPFVLRFPSSAWTETIAIYKDGIAYDPKVLHIDQSEIELERARLLRSLGSMSSSIIRYQWERWFYDAKNTVNATTASEYYTKCMGSISTRIDDRLEWANDIYIGRYEWYGMNYVIAFMLVEQLRSYATKQFGGPFTPEATWWLHEKCWWPGGVFGWRDMVQHATGEEFNPQYFFKALQHAGLGI